ncbi:MAG: hypothetical protein HKN03_16620 [Acidimicrobiales bacterium]|nr:hypothetical protein [Acidimicrobiales bacterium]
MSPPERPTRSKVGTRLRLWVLLITLAMTGCGSTADTTTTGETERPSDAGATAPTMAQASASGETELFPDVIGASATQAADGTWTISATISSPYDSPDRYADAWRVVGPDGTVFGERILTHDHASEQPFTRSQNGITIPSHITVVTIEGRDQQSGWGGTTFELSLGDQ